MQQLSSMLHLMIGGYRTMSTLLRLDSSPMAERSISRKLTERFADTWLKAHPGGQVIARDLTTLKLPVVDGFSVGAAHSPEKSRTADQIRALAVSDSLIADLQQADEYVFGVPKHNFGIPSTLKLWIDQVVRAEKTFSLATGGVYAQGIALASLDFVTPYLRTVLGFMGITDVTIITAEGTAQLMSGKVDSQTFLAPSLEKVHALANL
jgi:FMN-dependent NADH-azoreductase